MLVLSCPDIVNHWKGSALQSAILVCTVLSQLDKYNFFFSKNEHFNYIQLHKTFLLITVRL